MTHPSPAKLSDSLAGDRPLRRGRLSLALLLFSMALCTRLVGIDHGLPHFGEPDPYIEAQASSLIEGGITERSHAGWKYPHLVATIVALFPPEHVERLGPGAALAEHRELATRLRKRTRVVVATISSLAAPLTYLIAARFLAGRFAFLAGLLVASSLLHICFSVQARPHGPVSAFATFALLCAIRWRENPSLCRALWLGLGLAASIGTLHTGAAALAPAAAACVGLLRFSPVPKGRVLLGALLALLIASASAGWFYLRAEDGYETDVHRLSRPVATLPGGVWGAHPDDLDQAVTTLDDNDEDQAVFLFSGHVVEIAQFNGQGFMVVYHALSRYDPLTLLFAVMGGLALIALAVRQSSKEGAQQDACCAAWITILYAVPTLFVYGTFEGSVPRFYLLLMPATCMLAAFGLSWLWKVDVPRVITRVVVGASLGAIVLASVLAAQLRLSPDTYTLAAQAVEERCEGADPLVYTAEVIGLPLLTRRDMVQQDSSWARGPWDRYQWEIGRRKERTSIDEGRRPALGMRIQPAPISTRLRVFHADDKACEAAAALAEADADIVLLGTSRMNGRSVVGPAAIRDAWKAAVRADGRWSLVQTITNSRLSDHDSVGYNMGFSDVFTSKARGSEIEIWTRSDA